MQRDSKSQVGKEFANALKSNPLGKLLGDSPSLGAVFGRYQIVKKIGQGGMGQVYQAYDTRLNRHVALKLLLVESGENKERFLREAQAMAQLSHPNIISIYDVGEQEGKPFFAMDFISGSSLKDFLKTRPSQQQIIKILVSICKAIEHAHKQGIVHRDLKPANIMLDSQQEPKVMDFGLAKISKTSHKLSRTGTILGTLQYMSPEQANGDVKKIDERSDIYSLGVILYEAICNRLPFLGRNDAQMIFQILYNEPIPPSKIKKRVSKDLENICLKAMDKEKQHRYQCVQELHDDLERFQQGEVVFARPLGVLPLALRKVKNNPKIVIALGVFCVAIVVVIGVFLLREKELIKTAQKRFQKEKNLRQKKWAQIDTSIKKLLAKSKELEKSISYHDKVDNTRRLWEKIELLQKVLKLLKKKETVDSAASAKIKKYQRELEIDQKRHQIRKGLKEPKNYEEFKKQRNLIVQATEAMVARMELYPKDLQLAQNVLYNYLPKEEELLQKKSDNIWFALGKTKSAIKRRSLSRLWLQLKREQIISLKKCIKRFEEKMKQDFPPNESQVITFKLGYQYMRLGKAIYNRNSALGEKINYPELKNYFIKSNNYIENGIVIIKKYKLGNFASHHMNQYYSLLWLGRVFASGAPKQANRHFLDALLQCLYWFNRQAQENKENKKQKVSEHQFSPTCWSELKRITTILTKNSKVASYTPALIRSTIMELRSLNSKQAKESYRQIKRLTPVYERFFDSLADDNIGHFPK